MADNTYTKRELVEDLAGVEELGLTSKAQAGRVVESLIDHVVKALGEGKDVRLSGLMNASVEERAARTGRHPQTGEPIQIPARKAVKMKPAAAVKNAVSGS